MSTTMATYHIQQYPTKSTANMNSRMTTTSLLPHTSISPPLPLEPQDTEPDIDIGYDHDGQPTPVELRNMSIRVRDFGYESKLPPVKPYYRPTVLDVPTAGTSLRRGREEAFGSGSVDDEEGSPPKKRKSSRVMYPVWHPSHRQYPSGLPPLTPQHQRGKDEVIIATPFVTPNGSLEWPTSQRQDDDDEGTPPPDSQMVEDSQLPDVYMAAEEAGSSPIPDSSRSPTPTPAPQSSPLRIPPVTPAASVVTLAKQPSPRYKLRPRTVPPTVAPTTTSTTKRRKSVSKPASTSRTAKPTSASRRR